MYNLAKMSKDLPRLVTFDGEARSGKGTIVQAVKDYLRDVSGYKVMLIDAGQVFRVLVVAVTNAGVDINDPVAIDAFLSNEKNAEASVELVKSVYHMTKQERNALLYTNEVGANSAKIGARPLSQEFKDTLLRKWLRDAHSEGFEVVLLDGRALEETGTMLAGENLCDFAAHFYFVCHPTVGARRTLGFANTPYEMLPPADKKAVDELVVQVNERNAADRRRAVQPIVPPKGAPVFHLPNIPNYVASDARPTAIIDTSHEMTIDEMTSPMAKYVADLLSK